MLKSTTRRARRCNIPPELKESRRAVRIVQAAGKLFARQGYHATSTREVAHLADVGENTIFRHFNSKEGLFWATLHAYFTELEFPKELRDALEQYKSPEVVLPKILELFADTADFRPELIRLIAVASVELQGKTDAFYQQHLSPVFSVINHYFETGIKSGKIRDLDSTMLTSALVMTALTHPRIYNLIEGEKPSYSNRLKERRVRAMFWLDILAPKLPVKADASPSHPLERQGERARAGMPEKHGHDPRFPETGLTPPDSHIVCVEHLTDENDLTPFCQSQLRRHD